LESTAGSNTACLQVNEVWNQLQAATKHVLQLTEALNQMQAATQPAYK
jgi:hypothetical protein